MANYKAACYNLSRGWHGASMMHCIFCSHTYMFLLKNHQGMQACNILETPQTITRQNLQILPITCTPSCISSISFLAPAHWLKARLLVLHNTYSIWSCWSQLKKMRQDGPYWENNVFVCHGCHSHSCMTVEFLSPPTGLTETKSSWS